MNKAHQWIDGLKLQPHPEGGYYRETYRAEDAWAEEQLPGRYCGSRAFSTAIYYLLAGKDFSAFHRLKQDEMWHFYDGSSVTLHVIDPDGGYSTIRLGRDLHRGEVPQAVITGGCYFAAAVSDANAFALVGCTVAPGFQFEDFDMPGREELCARFPQHVPLIRGLTRV